MKQAERIGWIDTLRAFAVFAIVLGHTLRNATVVYPWLYSFHVPLCVLTLALYFMLDRKNVWYISKRKIQSTHDSVYCFALISIALYAILGSKMEKTVGGG